MQRVAGEAMGPAFGRVTIYTNAEDKALAAAKGLFKQPPAPRHPGAV